MTDREAMQQALEALENHATQRTFAGGVYIANAAIALRERLAQPEQEPLQFKCTIVDDAHPNGVPLSQWGKQPEQEPVATLDDLEQEIYENTRQFVSHDVMEWMLKRYYTTPPKRKPLTDEEIESINVRLAGSRDLARLFARAIEAAHGIKGEA